MGPGRVQFGPLAGTPFPAVTPAGWHPQFFSLGVAPTQFGMPSWSASVRVPTPSVMPTSFNMDGSGCEAWQAPAPVWYPAQSAPVAAVEQRHLNASGDSSFLDQRAAGPADTAAAGDATSTGPVPIGSYTNARSFRAGGASPGDVDDATGGRLSSVKPVGTPHERLQLSTSETPAPSPSCSRAVKQESLVGSTCPLPSGSSFLGVGADAGMWRPAFAAEGGCGDDGTATRPDGEELESNFPQTGAAGDGSDGSPEGLAPPRRHRRPLSKQSATILKTWLQEHKSCPYPSAGEKALLAKSTRLTLKQVSVWLCNARLRLLKRGQGSVDRRARTGAV